MRPTSACDVEHVPVKAISQNGLEDAANALSSQDPTGQDEGVYVFPASLEQIRYWTLDQLDGASTASNMAIAARLEGVVLDVVVERAIQALVERHEALRTTFRLVEGKLCQIIREEPQFSFSITDLRRLPDPERPAAAEAAVEDHSHARADLASGPILFVRLIHLTDQQHILAFTMHHIACDGWSNGILIRDFTDLYGAFSKDTEPTLPTLPFQFADFTVWQQKWLESSAAEAALNYWRAHILRELPAVDLPTDFPRQAKKSYPGNIESTLLPDGLTARLKAYCRAQSATMHQVLLAAFEALVARYTNQNEFLLGSTIANRTQPDMENVVGRFANPQVILADVSGDPSYSKLLRRVIDLSTEAYAHQDLPFSRLMEEFQLDQAGASSQFLQVYFVYQKAFMQPQQAQGLTVTPRPSVSGGVNFDLLVSIVERAEGPRLQMEYNTVLFSQERILRLIEMFIRTLEAVMEDDSIAVSALPLSSHKDKLPANTGTSPSLLHLEHAEAGQSLPEWLDAQADKFENVPAIFEQQQFLTWKTLRQRSRSVASSLTALGVTAGQTVVLRLESSSNTVAAAWAILGLGAVVLPLPMSATPEEWSQVTAAKKPALALASAAFARRVPGIHPYESLLANDAAELPPSPVAYPAALTPAWIGVRTTQNNGFSFVASTHRETLNQLLAAASALDLRAGDQVLISSAESAIDAWTDILLPLVAGASLLFAEGEIQSTGTFQAAHEALPTAAISKFQPPFVFTSPAALLEAVQGRWAGDRRLNVVLRGGILNAGQLERLAATPLRLWAMLSSAPTAGPMAIARVSGTTEPSFTPLTGQSLAVLAENDSPVPPGVSGELALAVDGTPRRSGYLARATYAKGPEETQDGRFHLIDLFNRQVRLHGFRLRLGEAEEILWQSASVADAAAAILPVDGVSALVVYFRPYDSTAETDRVIREHFKSVAPGHLASAELIAVSAIPHHSDGSINFSALPLPGATKLSNDADTEYLAPRDELEASLVAIWEDVLGKRPIGVRTPFFKLGGYSLMIVRLFARINKTLGTSLPITTIFNAPTVEQLAGIVRGRAYYSSLVPVHTGGTRPPFFMIHSYLLYQGIPKVLGPDVPFYGLRELDTDAEDMSVVHRAAAYLDAMRSIQPHGPYFIGGWCAAGPLAVETARQIVASGEQVGFLILFDSWRPGYSTELAKEQAGTSEMSFTARLGRKYRFHRNRWRTLSAEQKIRYVAAAIGAKIGSVRNRVYLKNWAIAEWFCHRFGLPLPHFMHNVSLTTLNSLKEYRGVEPYFGSITLIRAEEAPYIPGAKEHCGWDAIVKGGVKVLWAPGDHESMFLEPHLQTVGRLLHQGLEEAYAGTAQNDQNLVNAAQELIPKSV